MEIDPEEINVAPPNIVNRNNSSNSCCDICFEPYVIFGRWPMEACENGHIFCDECINGMLGIAVGEPVPCPLCRCPITRQKIRVNREVFIGINREQKVREVVKQQLALYAFRWQIFEIAKLFKDGKKDQIAYIQSVDASDRGIDRIKYLDQLKTLNFLNLTRNNIERIEGLQSLKKLKILNLCCNKIKEINGLDEMQYLQTLAIEHNLIQTIIVNKSIKKLKHLFLCKSQIYLVGNPLNQISFYALTNQVFSQISSLSISCTNKKNLVSNKDHLQMLIVAYIGGQLGGDVFLPNISSLSVADCFSKAQRQERFELLSQLPRKISIIWRQLQAQQQQLKFEGKKTNLDKHHRLKTRNWLDSFMSERYLYGEVVAFYLDPKNPHFKDYRFQGGVLLKKNSNFTLVNSLNEVNKRGKQNLKFRVEYPSSHMMVGVCNGFIKHEANIHSQHFVGLSFWGNLYVRGDNIPLKCKLPLQKGVIVRMCVDFIEEKISWFFEEREVGSIELPIQFRYSQVYFLIGIRDDFVSVTMMK